MAKVRCERYTCQHCVGACCDREVVTITANGCGNYRRRLLGAKDTSVWSTNPWDNYEKQGVQETDDVLE